MRARKAAPTTRQDNRCACVVTHTCDLTRFLCRLCVMWYGTHCPWTQARCGHSLLSFELSTHLLQAAWLADGVHITAAYVSAMPLIRLHIRAPPHAPATHPLRSLCSRSLLRQHSFCYDAFSPRCAVFLACRRPWRAPRHTPRSRNQAIPRGGEILPDRPESSHLAHEEDKWMAAPA